MWTKPHPYDTLPIRLNILLERNLPLLQPYMPYSARMSPETTHKLMRFYMEVLILGVIHVL